jgi:hypothetical protein
MKTMLLMVSLAHGLFAAALAQAQGLTQPWDEITPLTPQDRAIIRSTVERQIHGKRPETVATWNNPESRQSGTIQLLSTSTRQGMHCERIEYRIAEPGGAQQHGHYVFTSCQLPDGSWKLAE